MLYNLNKLRFKAFFALLSLAEIVFLTSCGMFGGTFTDNSDLVQPESVTNPATGIALEPFTPRSTNSDLPALEKPIEYGIELTWDIPPEAVEAFVIYSGISPDNLNSEIHVAVSDLQVIDGSKYRYLIKPFSGGEVVYVSLAALNKGVMSEKSLVQKIEADGLMSQKPEFAK